MNFLQGYSSDSSHESSYIKGNKSSPKVENDNEYNDNSSEVNKII